MSPIAPDTTQTVDGLFNWLARFKTRRGLAALLLAVNLGGVAYGFYYYSPQFALTPYYLWLFVPDSPLAVLWMVAVLALALSGRQSRWIDALAFVSLVKVGLWTAFVLLYYEDNFRILDAPLANLNFYLFWLHLGMVAEAFVLVKGFRGLGAGWPALVAWFLANDALDYFFPGFRHDGCIGTRPITVPCQDFHLLIPVTLALTVGSLALCWAMVRYAPRVRVASELRLV